MRSRPSLDTRKQSVLKAVVTDYVRTAEPVGSRALLSRYEFDCKSATLRNELAQLADLGYLYQPHTSAGRVPSDSGYRFYVDRLMGRPPLSNVEAQRARDRLAPRRTEVDIVLEQTCRVLSEMAHYTSLATHPTVKDAAISHVSVSAVARAKLLAVVVLDNGCVLHELLEFAAGSTIPDPARASGFLMRMLGGRAISWVASHTKVSVPEEAPEMGDLLSKVLTFLKRELETSTEADVHLEGASYIMHQPEFRDLEKLEMVLSAFEQRSTLYRLLSSVLLGPDVTVIIGSENPLDEMRDCSFVGAKYRIGGRLAGTIGVVGPTRMDYPRAVSAVEFMARNLGELLTRLSVA